MFLCDEHSPQQTSLEHCHSAGQSEVTRELQRGTGRTEKGGALLPESDTKYQPDDWFLVAALSRNDL